MDDPDREVDSGPAPEARGVPPRDGVRERLRDPGWALGFDRAERPAVSIIVVTFNGVEHTHGCLQSLRSHADLPHELILVDNGSTDETVELLPRLRSVAVVRNGLNLGFGHACNQAAARAGGEFLLFLNNDVTLLPRCVSTLVRTARADDRCGAVGGKLLSPGGRLQEAGSILWDDGTVDAYGRGSDPLAPEFSCPREVDFCSGALLLVRRDLFERVGGFDERYVPAYFEDVDLCLRLRLLGYRVLYEPGAIAAHHKHGSSTPEEAAELMRRNHARFVAKWGHALERQRSRSATAARRTRGTRREPASARPLYGVAYEASVPTDLPAGREVIVPVHLVNEGMLAWEEGCFRLSYHWRRPSQDAPLVWDGCRTYLPGVVSPREGVLLRARVEVPAAPGAYVLEWDLVIEGRVWLSELGVPTARHRVEVHPEQQPAPAPGTTDTPPRPARSGG